MCGARPRFFLPSPQSPAYLALLEAYISGADTYATTAAGVCAALRGKAFYAGTLDPPPDRISLPAHGWVATTPGGGEVVEELTCKDSLAIALCSGAPCYDNPTAPGALNVTCLCPVYPFGSADASKLMDRTRAAADDGDDGGGDDDDNGDDDDAAAPSSSGTSQLFRLTSADAGHLGGCESYARDHGPCALQHTATALKGGALRPWAVAAVGAMATAPRGTNTAICRDWFSAG